MTPKQTKFVRFYLLLDNATQAAIKAGYSKKSARQAGSRMLSVPAIEQAVSKGRARLAIKHDITMDWLTKSLLNVHDLAIEGQPLLDRYGNETGTVMRQLAVANKSIETIGKAHGLLVERQMHLHKSLDDMSEADLRIELAKGNEQLAKLPDVVVDHDTVDSE